jgi:hypothetical protein
LNYERRQPAAVRAKAATSAASTDVAHSLVLCASRDDQPRMSTLIGAETGIETIAAMRSQYPLWVIFARETASAPTAAYPLAASVPNAADGERGPGTEHRFRDIVDLGSGRHLFTIEHEVRSVTHPMYLRPLVNRNPLVTNMNYASGYDQLPWALGPEGYDDMAGGRDSTQRPGQSN